MKLRMFNLPALATILLAIASLQAYLYADEQPLGRVTLEECYTRAEKNYPLIQQSDLIEKISGFTVNNASRGYLPKITLTAQANYLSDVTSVPLATPQFSIDPISKDQYKIFGEIYQPLTDFYRIDKQKKQARQDALVEKKTVEGELYKLRERVHGLYFGNLLMKAQIQQTQYLQKDLSIAVGNVTASLENGLATENDLEILQAELLGVDQKLIEWQTALLGYLDVLGALIGSPVDTNTVLVTPPEVALPKEIRRTESEIIKAQIQSLEVKQSLINSRLVPQAGLYVQGGYGRPGLNQLDDEFTTYYLLGLRFNWNLTSFYTSGKEKKILEIKKKSLEVQNKTLLFNTQLAATQQYADVIKYQSLLESDQKIIILREKIKQRANLQLQNGVISTNEYIKVVNNHDKARQSLLIHQIQHLKAQYQHNLTMGASK